LTAALVLAATFWTGTIRDFADLQNVNPGAPHNVVSFLVTSFFARAKKEVTRSAAGRVEALHFKSKGQSLISNVQELDSRLRGNDEQKPKAKRESSPCAG